MIEKNYIFIDEKIENKEKALVFICDKAEKNNITGNKDMLKLDLERREEEFCTDLGMGLSIPHTKSDYVKEPAVFFIRYNNEIAWGENSNVKASLVFLTPKQNVDNIHLKMLSSISRRLMDKNFLDMLLSEGGQEEVFYNLSNTLKDII